MASSRKPPSGKTLPPGARLAVALSGGVDSVVLLHLLKSQGFPLVAVHVHHGLSARAGAWAAFCRRLCRRFGVPLRVRKVKVTKAGRGLEAAAREARYAVFRSLPEKGVVLAHHLDDQAETVLMNLLRGAGVRGASGMAPAARFHDKLLLRPLLELPRDAILDYARRHRLDWVEDESNADEALTRNFIRHRVGPLLATKFPQWRESLARAARHFSAAEIGREDLLRAFLREKGLKAPSEAKLVEMLKQLSSGGSRTLIEHDGARLRVYRGKVSMDPVAPGDFSPVQWKGERVLHLPSLGGELRFRRVVGEGIARRKRSMSVRLRAGGERLQPDARRPRRTLKNLFQEAGVPAWQRDRLPMIYSGSDLVWVPGLGVDARFQASGRRAGWMPEWRPNPLFL